MKKKKRGQRERERRRGTLGVVKGSLKKKQREISKMGDELLGREEEIFIHRMELWKAVIEGRVLFLRDSHAILYFC